MSTVFLFVVIGIVMAAVALLLWDWRALGVPVSLTEYERFLDRLSNRFDHLDRILSPGDFDYVRRCLRGKPQARAVQARMGQERRRVWRMVLRDLRGEFLALMAVGSMLAASPTARDSNFALGILVQRLRFHRTYFFLWASSWPGLGWLAGGRRAMLVHYVTDLREATRALMSALTADDMSHLRDSILG